MQPIPASSDHNPGLTTVLIVDDEDSVSEMLALGLEDGGYRTLRAANAADGWKLARAHLPDVILCDIEMPGKDGRRLLQEMRAEPELADRQFVLMTGKTELGNSRTAMDLGADDFLLKPFSLDDLFRCVTARLKRAALSRRISSSALEEMRLSLQSTLPQRFFTPLAEILGLARLLEEGLDTLGKKEMRQELCEIQDAGRQLHRNLRNYLLLLELEPQNVVRPNALLDGEMVVDALVSGINAAAKRHHRAADITRELDPAELRATAADLGTVAEELVDNALSFSRKGTPVLVKTHREGGTLHFTVTDAGRGMTPSQLEQITAAGRHDRKLVEQQGLGLGLVLVQRLVQHMGGEFLIESQAGKSTTSRVSLPIRTV
jgi:two-component system sensor kinase